MKPHFFKHSLFLFFISFIISCSKNADVTPNQNVVGTWKFQNTIGSAIVGGKTVDLAQTQDVGLSGQKIIFKADGSGSIDGGAITYNVSGNSLTITQSGVKLVMNVAVAEGVFTITADEVGLKDALVIQNALSTASGKITKLNQTLVYKSLESILLKNGTPDCVNTNYSSTNLTAKTNFSLKYNDERKLINFIYFDTILSSGISGKTINFEYKEVRNNLGSDKNPFVTELLNTQTNAKYYCDINSRVNRTEIFSSDKPNYPVSSYFYEYNTEGFLTKSSLKFQNTTNGDFTGRILTNEFEYIGGDLMKIYTTEYNGSTITTPRYLSTEYVRNSNALKTKIVYLFNYGGLSKNHISKEKTYNAVGTISNTASYDYSYTFDSKGFVLTQNQTNLNGRTIKNDEYIYQCN
jgi:hypothetical protein